jgi:hypothetical protein
MALKFAFDVLDVIVNLCWAGNTIKGCCSIKTRICRDCSYSEGTSQTESNNTNFFAILTVQELSSPCNISDGSIPIKAAYEVMGVLATVSGFTSVYVWNHNLVALTGEVISGLAE